MKGFEMQSTMKTPVGRRGGALKAFSGVACVIIFGLAGLAMTALPASAFVGGTDAALQQQLKQNSQITEVVVRRYTWRRGGAIAAGAAIGFVAAATAAAWAGAPPAPDYCWYYTDPGRTQGFWDVCPQ
jgi:hypothetical protein